MQKPTRPMPPDFKRRYHNETRDALCKHYQCGHSTFSRWAREAGLEGKRDSCKAKLPDNIEALAKGRNIKQLAAVVGLAPSTLAERLTSEHPKVLAMCRAVSSALPPLPDDFEKFAVTLSIQAACKHYQRDDKTIRRWIAMMEPAWKDRRDHNMKMRVREQQKINARNNFSLPRRAGTMDLPAVSGDTYSQAAHHLRRWFAPVYDAGKVYGKALAGVYVVGNRRMSADDMLALAEERGFDAGAWRRVA